MENVIRDIANSNLLMQAVENERTNKFYEAISYYEAAISFNQENYCAYLSLGALYEKLSNEAKAVDTYKKGIKAARLFQNKQVEKELSYTLLGLMD